MKKLLLLCTIGASLVTISALATEHKCIGLQVREYVWNNIIPVVMQKRSEFDINLNETEHAEVNNYREEVVAMREDIRLNGLDKNDATTAQKGQLQKYNLRLQKIMEQLSSIAENHKDKLDKIYEDISLRHMQWKSDIEQIENAGHGKREGICSEGNSSYKPLLTGTFGDSWINIDGEYGRSIFILLNPGSTPVPDKVSLNIYPNPAATFFSLNITGTNNIDKLVIIDMAGRLVSDQENVSPTEPISCDNMSNGIYLLQIYAEGQTFSRKLVVSR